MKNKIWIYALVFVIFSFTQCKMDDANANASTITDSTVVAGKDTSPQISEGESGDPFVVSIDSLMRRYRYDSAWTSMPEVLPGAILPRHRIIAFYGNLFSKRMGILGELPEKEMIAQLKKEMKNWEAADPITPLVPALHVIVTTAQRLPGRDKMYRLRMSKDMVFKVKKMADSINGMTFLDLQIGHSSVARELVPWDSLLSLPTVHLGLDPEFAMHTKKVPGTIMGRMDAADINVAIDFLEEKVKRLNLPPKVLIIHRFKSLMVSNAEKIKRTPYVQVVMDMDGWGAKELKFHSYRAYIQKEPVQYTGFKLFYNNDTKYGKKLLTPEEVLTLWPKPMYVQYQ